MNLVRADRLRRGATSIATNRSPDAISDQNIIMRMVDQQKFALARAQICVTLEIFGAEISRSETLSGAENCATPFRKNQRSEAFSTIEHTRHSVNRRSNGTKWDSCEAELRGNFFVARWPTGSLWSALLNDRRMDHFARGEQIVEWQLNSRTEPISDWQEEALSEMC